MKRHKHSLSNYKLLTCDMGELIPCGLLEVLPGDTIQQASAALIRVSPLVAPVMHPVNVRIHHWFVPCRILWDEWEDFITGGPDGMDAAAANYPTITAPGGGFSAGGLLDYFGVPPGIAGLEVNAMPVRAYNKIFNEYYRDQDLVSEVAEDFTNLQWIAWEKDYFTAARPWSQKGPDVTLPLGTEAPVMTSSSDTVTGAQTAMKWNVTSGNKPSSSALIGAAGTSGLTDQSGTGYTAGANLYPSNLFADLSSATAVNVNDVRRAFALQRYEEARSLYGSRYTEYLRYLGIRSSDARLQRPEYLGGGKQTISFSEILQTTPAATPSTSDYGVGDLYGHGIAAMRSRRYRRFFEEHGFVVSLLSVRPKSMYANGIPRMWNRRTKEDYWQKELELIGQQEVLNKEIYANAASPDGVFGYQDRYSEYRYVPSQVSGDFRSTLDYWHLARLFASEPALNSDFTNCVPSKRINAVQTEDVLWCMVNNSVQARRMVRTTNVGRII